MSNKKSKLEPEEIARANQKKFELEQQKREQQERETLEAMPPSASEEVFEGYVGADKESADYIVEMYTAKFKDETWYKPPEQNEGGSTRFSFPDEKTAMDFFGAMAKEEKRFIVIDGATGNVLAYSTGDGQLHKNKGNKLSLDAVREELEKAQQQACGPK